MFWEYCSGARRGARHGDKTNNIYNQTSFSSPMGTWDDATTPPFNGMLPFILGTNPCAGGAGERTTGPGTCPPSAPFQGVPNSVAVEFIPTVGTTGGMPISAGRSQANRTSAAWGLGGDLGRAVGRAVGRGPLGPARRAVRAQGAGVGSMTPRSAGSISRT